MSPAFNNAAAFSNAAMNTGSARVCEPNYARSASRPNPTLQYVPVNTTFVPAEEVTRHRVATTYNPRSVPCFVEDLVTIQSGNRKGDGCPVHGMKKKKGPAAAITSYGTQRSSALPPAASSFAVPPVAIQSGNCLSPNTFVSPSAVANGTALTRGGHSPMVRRSRGAVIPTVTPVQSEGANYNQADYNQAGTYSPTGNYNQTANYSQVVSHSQPLEASSPVANYNQSGAYNQGASHNQAGNYGQHTGNYGQQHVPTGYTPQQTGSQAISQRDDYYGQVSDHAASHMSDMQVVPRGTPSGSHDLYTLSYPHPEFTPSHANHPHGDEPVVGRVIRESLPSQNSGLVNIADPSTSEGYTTLSAVRGRPANKARTCC